MASFSEHISQVTKNISFLEQINKANNYWDWQTTVCFYIGVHIINSHLAIKADLHYRSHEEVSNAINPYNKYSVCSLPPDVYTAFINLQWLSRRSRYLISDKKGDFSTLAHFTSEKHFAKAVRHLDMLMNFINTSYDAGLPKISIVCEKLKTENLAFFKIS